MKDKLLSKQGWVILLICIISFFINNRVVVPDIMEARNMVTAREMVHDGNWLVPTMNGDLRLEKPPLPTWLTAVAEMISPDNLALQRAMAGFAAILLVAFFYLTAVQVMRNKRYAFISTILLCTCYNIILMGRTASWDIVPCIYDGGDLFPYQGICDQSLFLERLYLGRRIYGAVVYE